MKALELAQVFTLPLQSAIRAQSLALQETMAAIETLGIEAGRAKQFRLKAERVVEEREIDSTTGEPRIKVAVQPFELSIPLLALLPVTPVQLKEMDVDFGLEIIEPKLETITSAVLPAAALGSSLSKSSAVFTALGQSNPTTMKVHMKIARESTEGIARMGDLLADLLSGKADANPSVEEIPGIPKGAVTILRTAGILTVGNFLVATEVAANRSQLAKTLGVRPRDLESWRKHAERVVKLRESTRSM